jgi:hypothetical protein
MYFDMSVSYGHGEPDRFMFFAISQKYALGHLLPFAKTRQTSMDMQKYEKILESLVVRRKFIS